MARKKKLTPLTREEYDSREDKTLVSLFEWKYCGRCGGSGEYSFNYMDGTRCYGCGGSGKKWTKRGLRQRARYFELQSVPASEIEPGDTIWTDGSIYGGGGWRKVTKVEPSVQKYTFNGERREDPIINLHYKAKIAGRLTDCSDTHPPTHPVRKTWPADKCYEAYVEALNV